MKKQLLFITALLFVTLSTWAQTTTVNSLGESSGWYSDDTRNTAGTVLNGLVSSSPVYFQNIPGTIINDAAISQQIKFGDFYAGSSGGVLQLDGTTANTGKSSVKKYGLEVLGSELTSFSSTFRWYKDPYTTERTVGLSLLVLGSDNKSYSLAYVGEGSVIGWNEFAVNASTLPTNTTGYGWFIYNNGAPGATVPGRSLNGLLADPVYGSLLTDGTVYAQGFNIGSYQRNCRIGIDWLESSFINYGSRVDFVTGATTWFVNDNSLTGNVYTTAVGNDANAGTAAAPFLTISKALSVASNGDVIYADAGSYNEYLTLSKSVTLNGANAGIHPDVGTHATEVVGTRGTETILNSLSPAADNITIDGIHFLKAGTRLIDTYNNANNFVMRNCIVESTVFGASTGVIQFGGGSHTGCIFEYNLFKDKGDHTFYAGGGPYDGLTFQYNKFNVEGDAIFWAATPLVNGVIHGNEFDGTIGSTPGLGYCTVNIGQGGNILITDNYVHDVLYTAFQVGIINGSITGNTFDNTYPLSGYWASAFELWGGQWGTAVSTNVTVSGNTFNYNDISGATYPTHGLRLRAPETGSGIDASTIHVANNRFIDGGVRTDAKALRHQGDQNTSVDADLNYWGSATPDFASIFQGPVIYCPWYTDAELTTTAGNVHNVTQNAYYCTIQSAIAAADANDVIEVAAGTYVESGQIVISKNLTITGADKANTIIKPAANQTNWFQVNTGVTLNLSKVKLDGTGRVITHAINFQGNGVVDDCWFTEIKGASKYAYGTGVQVNGSVSVNILNCTFDNVGRTGIRHSGTGTVNGNTYTGKGEGDYLDYFILAEYGCNITIDGNTVTNCTGVASSDDSGSSAIAIWDDENTTVNVVNNILTGNTNGIGFAAINSLDPSWTWPHATIGSGNVITGGDEGISFYAYGDYTHTPVVTITGTSISSVNALNIGLGVVVTNIAVNGNSLVATTGFGVANSGSGSLDAECNWFGTTDYNTILTKVSGDVDFVNYLVTNNIVTPVCTGGVWPVHNSTKNIYYQTIQAAVTAATAGDVIEVAAGTYNESVALNKSLTIQGAGCEQSIWQGSAITGRSLLIQRNNATPANVHAEISGFSFNTENNQSIRADWSASYTETLTMDIHDNCFAHVNSRNPGNDFALYVDGANQTARSAVGAIRVYDNIFNVTGGVLFEYCRAADVIDNIFNVTYEAVTFNSYSNAGTIGDHLVTGNTFNHVPVSWAFAINTWFGSGAYTALPSTITNNLFTNSGFSYAIVVGVEALQSAPFDLFVNQNSILSGTITTWGDYAYQAQIDATCNWWGTANPAAIDAKVSDNVEFMPFKISEEGACNGGPIVVYQSDGATFVSSHETIQAAIDASTTLSSYVISVPAGTYDYISEGSPAPSGLIKVTKGVTIKAAVGARPIIDGSNFDGVFKIHPSALNPGNTVIIEGFEIKGNAATGIAMTMQGCFDVTPAKVIIRDNWFHGMVGGIDFWGAGAYLPIGWTSALANIEITNNKFYDMVTSGTNQGFGAMIEDPANWATVGNDYAVKIIGNEFSNLPSNGSNPGAGIVLPRANDTWEAANVFISGNTFNNNVAVGVAVMDGDVTNALVEHNAFGNSLYGVMTNGIDNGPVTATCNWWGTTDYNTILTKVNGNVDFVNYLVTENIVTPLCTGGVWPVHNVTQNTYYQTIQAAISGATAGDVIEVAAGTYTENIDVSKALTILGPNASVTGNGTRNSEAVVEGPFLVNANNVTIKGFFIDGTNVNQTPDLSKRGVLVGNVASQTNVTIENNIIKSWVTGVSLAGGYSFPWNETILIKGNKFMGTSIGSTENVNGLSVLNNYFDNAGVGFGGGAILTALTGNTFINGTGRYVSAATGVVIDFSNVLANNTFDKTVYLNSATGQWYDRAIFTKINSAATVATAGATLLVSAGTFAENVTISKSMTIDGAGEASTLVTPTTLITSGIAHHHAPNVKAAFLVNNGAAVTLKDLTIDFQQADTYDAVLFWNASSGSIENVTINADHVFTSMSGHGLMVDATSPSTVNLSVTNCTFSKWNRNAIDAVNGNSLSSGGGNMTVNVTNCTLTGRNDVPTLTCLQNGINIWNRGGGVVNSIVDGVTLTNLTYDDGSWISYGIAGPDNDGMIVKNCVFTNMPGYIGSGEGDLDATLNNSFDGVNPATATLVQNYAIEDKISHVLDADGYAGFVRVKANHVFVTANSASIQRGIDAATADDIVNVAAGTFNEVLNMNKALFLLGPNSSISAVTGTRLPEAQLTQPLNIPATEDVVIKGFEFSNVDAGSAWPIYIYGSSNGFEISNNRFINCIQTPLKSGISSVTSNILVTGNLISSVTGSGHSGISLGGVSGTSSISQNKLMNLAYGGILIDGAAGLTVSGNEIDNAAYQGIQLAGVCGGVSITNNTINSTNTSNGEDRGGIRLYGSSFNGAITIEQNKITNSFNGVAIKTGQNITGKDIHIHNNWITGNANAGVYHGGTGTLDALHNYWVCPVVSGPVTYFPYWSTVSGTPGSFTFDGSISNITASATNLTICAGSTTTIFASGGSDYSWDNGLGLGSSKVVSPTVTTTYNVTGKDANGCTGAFASVTVTVTAPPTVTISGDGTIPQGGSTTLTASSATTYVWSTGATTAAITVSPTSTTTYSVTGYIGSCSGTASKTVKVAYVDAGSNQFICNGGNTTLTATSSGISSPDYVWTPGEHSGATFPISPVTTTTYTVTVVKDEVTFTDQVTVFVNPKPIANAGSDITIASGGTGTLIGNASSGTAPYSYSWSGPGIVGSSTTKNITVNVEGTYSLIVTDAFGCISSADAAVVTVATSGYTVSGNVSYYNSLNPQMHNVTITLKQGSTTMYTAVTPASGMGNYQFLGVADGTYTVHFSLPTAWGGVTSADIIAIQNHYKNVNPTLLVGLKRLAADVIDNGILVIVNANDRNQVNAKRVNPNGVNFATGNWVFVKADSVLRNDTPFAYANSAGASNTTLTVSGSAVTMNYKSLCYGDVDASYSGYKEDEQIINLTANNGLELINFPNPFDEMTTIEFKMPVEGLALLEVFDLMGNKVYTIADPDNYEGSHTLYFKAGGLAPGIYIYKVAIKTSDDVLIQTGKMVISR